ncbi:NAD(P)/FAD-dependent oxidoreductase [uncultured Croceitalea sp.]|uniref:NAD(P)/FAD-dependent oxidoreductase n=1 Tax=uncultured Croceitalea sp. TaxID=1798908 RepID=UPI00374F0EFB
MLDYIVVGLGLAGISFCEQLENNGKSFKIISDSSQQASLVAGGLYNPVILKRFTMAWNAKEQLDLALPFYKNLEKKLKVKLDYKLPVLRRFASIEEQNGWFEATDKPGLDFFLDTNLLKNKNLNIDAPFGYGQVKDTGRIDTKILLKEYQDYLIQKELIVGEAFDFNLLQILDNNVEHNGLKARQIVFAEGFGLKNNPFFNYLPLNGTKGELLTIKAPSLKEDNVIKSSVFIIPLRNDFYRIGATYKWKDKTNEPTLEAKEELVEKLKTFLKCDFEIVKHVAGVRPTVADRRPLVGRHPKHKSLYVLNGFGSRGVMIAPYASKQLFHFIENNENLNSEMNISRFTEKHYNH